MIAGRLSAIALLFPHLVGGAFAAQALVETWRLRMLLEVIFARATGFDAAAFPWLLLGTLFALVLLAFVRIGALLRRIWRGEPEEDVALRLRGAFYAAVGCVCFTVFLLQSIDPITGPARLRFPVLGSMSAAFAYGALALWSLSLRRPRRALRSKRGRTLDLACMNLCAAVVLAELALRGLAVLWPNPLLATESASPQVRRAAGRQAPGAFHLSFPVNAGGHYDGEFLKRSERQTRVVVGIGDSFSYGVVPHAYHFTTVAERELPGIEIYNMGYPAIGPSDYLYLLEHEALPLEPELVIVQIFVGNDVTALPHYLGPPAWYDADRYLLPTAIWRLRRLSQAELPGLSEAANLAISTREELIAHYPWLEDPFAETPSFSARHFLELESGQARKLCGSDESYYPHFFEMLEQMGRVAGDVPLAFVLIPDEFQVEDAVWEQVEGTLGGPLDRDKVQRKTREWLEQRGRPVLDLLPLLRDVEPLEDGRRHLYHLRDFHFNARGNEVAGRAIAQFVRSLLVNPPPPPAPVRFTEEPPRARPTEIVRDFGRALSATQGGLVIDASRLPHRKRDVARALRELLAVAQEPSDQAFLRAALERLAFFQPDVGDEPVDLDTTRADGATWRSIVEAELRVGAAR